MRYLFIISIFLCACSDTDYEGVPDEDWVDNLMDTANDSITSEELLPEIEDTATFIIEDVFTSEAFFTENIGWGYKILRNDTMYINQPHIPAVSGNKGFSSEEKALTTANYAIDKIYQGQSLPAITPQELDSLGVLD